MLAENFAQIFPGFHPFDDGLESVNQLENADFPKRKRCEEGCAGTGPGAREGPLLFQGEQM